LETNGTDSGLCPVVDFGISGFEPASSAAVLLVHVMLSTV